MNLIDRMNWDRLKHEYNVDAKRLLPWEGLSAPFGGAWVVVRPGTISTPHVNDPPEEAEIFICISGAAKVCVGKEIVDVTKGDLVYFPPGTFHYIENPHQEDFHLYSIWWDPISAKKYLNAQGADE